MTQRSRQMTGGTGVGDAADAIDRNLALELVRVTEAAAMLAARWMGRGDKKRPTRRPSTRMRFALDSIEMDGIVVIGEGEKDEAPMLYIGEHVGNGADPKVDIAVDPIDGTRLLSIGHAERRLGRRAGRARLDARLAGHRLHGEDRGRAEAAAAIDINADRDAKT